MSAALASFSVRLPELIRTTTFRWTLAASGALAFCILLMFGFVYWQTAAYMTARVDGILVGESEMIAGDPPERRLKAIHERLSQDPRRIRLAGLFGANGSRIAGNLESLPDHLPIDTPPQRISVVRIDERGREEQTARAVARRLQSGEILVIGRNVDELSELARIVERALEFGLIPALALSLAAGAFLSRRAQNRVETVNEKVQRIIAGDLRERLPTQGLNDPFDKLAVIVNGMLDEIEALIRSIAGAGDDIAHDLRTPLTRVRIGLERGRDSAQTLPELQNVVDQAIGRLDQSLAIITALLRIAEIEHSRRLEGFGDVALADVVREVGDLYEPIAEDKRIAFKVTADVDAMVRGDRDLIFEAIANLVDNAVKFTPEDGCVELALTRRGSECAVRIHDSGPGISASERDLVARRFYRSDNSRQADGLGLGLSLVNAIVKLHGFRLTISTGAHCVVEIACPCLGARSAAEPAPVYGSAREIAARPYRN
jgi:signal transduction histidine kinase